MAAVPAPGWTAHSLAVPTVFAAADNENEFCASGSGFANCDSYQVTVTNAGGKETDGTPVLLADTLPPGLEVQHVALFWSGLKRTLGLSNTFDLGGLFCSTAPVKCQLPFAVAPDETLEMVIYLTVPAGGESLRNAVSVSGGGAQPVSTESTNRLGGAAPLFGAGFSAYIAGSDGAPETQAGGHPYELSTRIDFNNAFMIRPDGVFGASGVQDPKDVVVDLPLGFLGSANATPRCTFAELSSHIDGGVGGCRSDTIVGHIFTEPVTGASVQGPLYNMAPEHGVAAEFGFVDLLAGPHALYASVVPTSAGYVLRTTAPDIPQVPLTDVVVTLYGDPAAKEEERTHERSVLAPTALFTNPSNCSGRELTTTLHMDSWQAPARLNADGTPDLSDPRWVSASSGSPAVNGCSSLRFDAAFSLQPDTTVADSPAGVEVDVKVPQSEELGALATPPLRKAVVTLPAGLSVNPGAAQGLGACSPAQIALQAAASPTCPEPSKIGTVELSTPLLPETQKLKGAVYVASQGDNPFASLLAAYIVIDDADTGIVAKIPVRLSANPETGQITAVVDNAPQLPFSELTMRLNGGPRGVLATPESCGTFTARSVFSPWSAPDSGPDASPFDSFTFSSGCASGFAPSFTAGTTVPQAGAFSPFVMSFSRSDTDQEISSLSVTLPPGLLARIAGVQRCSDAQLAAAAANPSGASETASSSCPAASQVGTVQAGAGPGPSPIFVSGKAYLTGAYKGAPYGLAVVVPAVAGPFDLGKVVVRTSLHIDPTDGHVTAVSDPFPTMVNQSGIPVRLRRVDITIDRPGGFTFNPTSCEAMAVDATLTSTGGLSATASPRFQVGGCQGLAFKPRFSASTQGHTSKTNGASLTVDVTQRPGEANIHKVEVQLPLALPSRLSTLQKACTETQFNTNPAGCPPGSQVGSATAVTPVLGVPLSGPGYLVSHGSAAFPDLEFVLQGDGVTIILDGKTDIKHGITYSRFQAVPDAPINSFRTSLPEGPHSILAANVNLCKNTRTITAKRRVRTRSHGHTRTLLRTVKRSIPAPLLMPTTITAQNGVVTSRNTPIQVTGCTSKRAGHHEPAKRRHAKKR